MPSSLSINSFPLRIFQFLTVHGDQTHSILHELSVIGVPWHLCVLHRALQKSWTERSTFFHIIGCVTHAYKYSTQISFSFRLPQETERQTEPNCSARFNGPLPHFQSLASCSADTVQCTWFNFLGTVCNIQNALPVNFLKTPQSSAISVAKVMSVSRTMTFDRSCGRALVRVSFIKPLIPE